MDYPVLKFEHPSTYIIAGPTGCGKTHFVRQCIIDHMLEPFPEQIHWFYAEEQPINGELKDIVQFHKDAPLDFEDYTFHHIPTLIILDDLMQDSLNSKQVASLFTKGSHHRNLSVMLLSQNLYFQGKQQRTISLNTQYTVLFKNDRDARQIMTFAMQYAPGKAKAFSQVFEECTKRQYGYLVVDTKPGTPKDYQLRTNIFPHEVPTLLWCWNGI